MNKRFFSNDFFQKWLFLLGGVAFVLSLLKNCFLEQHPGIYFYMLEFMAFLFFLAAFYLSDRNNQQLRSKINDAETYFEEEKEKLYTKIKEFEDIVSGYELRQNEAIRFASYQDGVIEKLVRDERVYSDKHHLLHLLSEIFNGMAVIFYKKDEPSGKFIVESTYGLSDDFNTQPFEEGEGLHGQAILEGKASLIEDIPEDYVEVNTGLGNSREYFLYLLPILKNNGCTGMIELMTFREADVLKLWPVVMDKLVVGNIL
jgi:hypothetical protein